MQDANFIVFAPSGAVVLATRCEAIFVVPGIPLPDDDAQAEPKR